MARTNICRALLIAMVLEVAGCSPWGYRQVGKGTLSQWQKKEKLNLTLQSNSGRLISFAVHGIYDDTGVKLVMVNYVFDVAIFGKDGLLSSTSRMVLNNCKADGVTAGVYIDSLTALLGEPQESGVVVTGGRLPTVVSTGDCVGKEFGVSYGELYLCGVVNLTDERFSLWRSEESVVTRDGDQAKAEIMHIAFFDSTRTVTAIVMFQTPSWHYPREVCQGFRHKPNGYYYTYFRYPKDDRYTYWRSLCY